MPPNAYPKRDVAWTGSLRDSADAGREPGIPSLRGMPDAIREDSDGFGMPD